MEITADLPVKGGDPKRYRAVCKLGGGTFGDILAAVNENDAEDWIALKIEARYAARDKERKHSENSMVRFERLVCQELRNCAEESGGCPCPVVHRCFCEAGEHDILAMELLGPHLRDYATAIKEWPLPQDIVLTVGACLIGRLQQLHAAGFVHRDLKPENVLLRLEEAPGNGVVPCFLLVDYALAMRIAQLDGSGHIEEKGEAQTAGTFRYMAVHAQKSATQSRRSDLESLAYVLIYLAKGQLPWQSDDPKVMVEKKESIPIQELCAGLHPAFAEFLQTTQNFSFAETPNYESLMRGLLDGVSGPLDFQAAKVRHDFKQKLRLEHLRCQAARAALVLPAQIRQPAPAPWVRIFVRSSKTTRFECSELSLHRPSCLEHFESPRSFFFEAFRDPLPGTVHVIGGSLHFFGFLKKEYLLQAIAEELAPRSGIPLSNPAAGVEEVLVFSSGKRDFVTRRLSIPDFNMYEDKPYKEQWNLRAAFWSRVCAPTLAVA